MDKSFCLQNPKLQLELQRSPPLHLFFHFLIICLFSFGCFLVARKCAILVDGLWQSGGMQVWAKNDPNMLNLYLASDVTPSLSLGAKAPIEGKKEESTCTHSCSQGNSGSPQMAFFAPFCPDFSTRFGLNSTPIWGGPLLSAIWIQGWFEGEFFGGVGMPWEVGFE